MKLYIAGPDVFRPDAAQWAADARALCRRAGHEALIPLDGVETTAAGIYHANIDQIRAADAVLANLNPFAAVNRIPAPALKSASRWRWASRWSGMSGSWKRRWSGSGVCRGLAARATATARSTEMACTSRISACLST